MYNCAVGQHLSGILSMRRLAEVTGKGSSQSVFNIEKGRTAHPVRLPRRSVPVEDAGLVSVGRQAAAAADGGVGLVAAAVP